MASLRSLVWESQRWSFLPQETCSLDIEHLNSWSFRMLLRWSRFRTGDCPSRTQSRGCPPTRHRHCGRKASCGPFREASSQEFRKMSAFNCREYVCSIQSQRAWSSPYSWGGSPAWYLCVSRFSNGGTLELTQPGKCSWQPWALQSACVLTLKVLDTLLRLLRTQG